MKLSDELQRAVAGSGAIVKPFPFWLRPFLAPGVAGITLGRRIFVAGDLAGKPPAQIERLLRHELVHVRQVNRLGLVRFLWRYAGEYVRNRRAGLPSGDAYRRISFEQEAYAAEEVEYS
jgi:hypothetical protein